MSTITRLGSISPHEFYERFVATDTPVILTQLTESWPARRLWTPEYFQRRFGNARVEVEMLRATRPGENANYLDSVRTCTMNIADYVNLAQQCDDGSVYAAQQPLRQLVPAAAQDIRPIPYASQLLCRIAGTTELLWIGPKGCTSGLHFDRAHNFNVQLYGRKRWVIFPRAQQSLLYLPSTLKQRHFSPIDYDHPDFEQFPNYRSATPLEFDIESGETLFLPHGWVHHVRTLEFSIALNLWWLTYRQAAAWAPGFLRTKLKAALRPSLTYR